MIYEKLEDISKRLKSKQNVEAVSVRNFLSWFGMQRRTWGNVSHIRHSLKDSGLLTYPDFEYTWIDGFIEFVLEDNSIQNLTENEQESSELTNNDPIITWISRDPTYRVSKLEAANRQVTIAKPDMLLSEAITMMMANDFSQLPVMTNDRDLKGVISWKSLGTKLALGLEGSTVRQLMEHAHEVRSDSSIFEVIPLIVQHDYVLVRSSDARITGIVTASDLSLQFRTLTEPFLLLSEIENLVRNLIGDRFSLEQLNEVKDQSDSSREIKAVSDLTFGEYIRLLESPERWKLLNISIDRKIFCNTLDKVRLIRNDVTHFDPDGIAPEGLETLRNATKFMKQLDSLIKI